MGTNFLGTPNSMDFIAFSQAMGNWRGNPCISHIIKYTVKCESNGKKHTIVFFAFSHTVGNLWGSQCIFHMLKYTIGWESDRKKAPILREKYDYRFPRLSQYHGFCCLFPYRGKFMRKAMHFPYNDMGQCFPLPLNIDWLASYSSYTLLIYSFEFNRKPLEMLITACY